MTIDLSPEIIKQHQQVGREHVRFRFGSSRDRVPIVRVQLGAFESLLGLAMQEVVPELVSKREADKLQQQWSPRQVAGWLQHTYPDAKRVRLNRRVAPVTRARQQPLP